MSKSPPRGPVGIFVEGDAHGLTVRNSTAVGMKLLQVQGTAYDLKLTLNKVYGVDEAVLLGAVFGAKIDSNLFDREFPKDFVREAVAAAHTENDRKNFLSKLRSLITDPAQISAVIEVAEKIWHAGKPVIGL